jgi:hypothetical protein
MCWIRPSPPSRRRWACGLEPFRQAAKLLSTMPGLSAVSANVVVAEIGIDMSRFATPGHLLSWACLCPRNDESAGKRRSTRLRRGGKWLKTTLVQAAWAAVKVKAATCRPSSTACVPVAAPRRPSSPWPPRCSRQPGTCCATAPSGIDLGAAHFDRADAAQDRCTPDPQASADRLHRAGHARLSEGIVSFQQSRIQSPSPLPTYRRAARHRSTPNPSRRAWRAGRSASWVKPSG